MTKKSWDWEGKVGRLGKVRGRGVSQKLKSWNLEKPGLGEASPRADGMRASKQP